MIDAVRQALGIPADVTIQAPDGGTLYGPPLPDPAATASGGPPQLVALPTVNIATGVQVVNLPAFCREGGQLRLANNGPFDLVISYGGVSRNLVHGLVDLMQLPPETLQLTVTATLAPGQLTNVATLQLDFAYPGETIEGTYPTVISGSTVNIGTMPAVTGAVTISSGIVNIGTIPAVTIASGVVNIGTMPAVTIASGTVNIGSTANINIASQSVNVNVQLPWVAVGSHVLLGGGAESFVTAAVGAGALTLGIAMETIGTALVGLEVTGVTSGVRYEGAFAGAAPIGGWLTIPINAALDSTYTISWTSSTGAGPTIAAFASTSNMGYPGLGQESMATSVPVTIAVDQSTLKVTEGNPGQKTMALSMPVAIASDQSAAPWQAATKTPATFSGAANPAIAAVAGQIIYLHSITAAIIAAVAATGIEYEDTTGVVVGEFSTVAVGNAFTDYKGAPLVVGRGLKSVLVGAPTVVSTVAYSQQ